MEKTLILMRHAKSSWNDNGLRDIDRPLNRRGRLASVLMGQFLAEQDLSPDFVMLSPALRVQQTWTHLSRILPSVDHVVVTEDALYSDGPSGLIKHLSSVPQASQTLLMIAHQPTLSMLVQTLTGIGLPDFPTAAVATLALDDTWQHMRSGHCTLEDFTRPKQLV